MKIATTAKIHPSAIVSAEAEIGENVEIGPFVIIDGAVSIGAGCKIHARATILDKTMMGRDNVVGVGTILGDRPQHLNDAGIGTWLEIGDNNTFREYVTVHRGTQTSQKTVIGSGNYFMINSHLGHDVSIGNQCIIVNGALLAGHCQVQDRVFISGNSAVHQFCRLGKLSLLSGVSALTMDIPPYVLVYGRNQVSGINVIGMRRAGIPSHDINAVRQAFQILYRKEQMIMDSVIEAEKKLGHLPIVAKMIQFIRESKRGCLSSRFLREDLVKEAA